MRPEQLLDAMSGIADKYLEESEKKVHFFNWKVLAACACLTIIILGPVSLYFNLYDLPMGGLSSESMDAADEMTGDMESKSSAGADEKAMEEEGFSMNGYRYIRADAEMLEAYGYDDIDIENISGEDRGPLMGTVEESENEDMIGCLVYCVKGYEDSDEICLVEQDDTYTLYCARP